MRYGFHGLSYEYIAGELAKHLPPAAGKVVVAHLGNGASMRALDQGKSVASTMGFSALDGLPMGTRCGNIDPGVVLCLLQEKRLDANAVSHLLCQESGLLGVSGISNDVRDLVQSDSPHAARALDIMVYRIVRELGSLATAMQGLDAIVFTLGIGEHAAQIRERVCDAAGWLGVALDHAAKLSGKSCISTPQSKVSAWVILTNEELAITQHVRRLTLFDAVAFKMGPMSSSHCRLQLCPPTFIHCPAR